MMKLCIAAGVTLAMSALVAGSDDWVFDDSNRDAETTSTGSASLSSVFESRSVSAIASAAAAVDSRYCDLQSSVPTALDSTKRGLILLVR